jgi:hypothetical protein
VELDGEVSWAGERPAAANRAAAELGVCGGNGEGRRRFLRPLADSFEGKEEGGEALLLG